MLLLTGGSGFIGTNFILEWFKSNDEPIINIDKLTYAANPFSLNSLKNNPRYILFRLDICNAKKIKEILLYYKPRAIVHFAAESHVDRSISRPKMFMQTNIIGTFTMLEAARCYWHYLSDKERTNFRFLHVSTDEVYGSLNALSEPCKESTSYKPNNPYAASKASSNHLVHSYFHTYGLPVLITNCSNNYGPYQFPEKLIPKTILSALAGNPIHIYGDGENIRDWIYVLDHCTALREILAYGIPGESYNISNMCEWNNLQVVNLLCDLLQINQPKKNGKYQDQIVFVNDRLGHDRRYALDSQKIRNQIGWRSTTNFYTGCAITVNWYVYHSKIDI